MSKTFRSACRNKHEDWNGFYLSTFGKDARRYHMTPSRVANLYEKYEHDEGEASLDDAEEYLSFDEWLRWKNYITE